MNSISFIFIPNALHPASIMLRMIILLAPSLTALENHHIKALPPLVARLAAIEKFCVKVDKKHFVLSKELSFSRIPPGEDP